MNAAFLKRKFNPRHLFLKNEEGIWIDPSRVGEIETQSWRRNLLIFTEGNRGGQPGNYWTAASNLVNSTVAMSGFTNSLYFSAATNAYAVKKLTTKAGTTYACSFFVEVEDGRIPVVGTTSSSGTFCVLGPDELIYTGPVTIQRAYNNIYRLSFKFIGTGTYEGFGVRHYSSQSEIGFHATGFQLEIGDVTDYQAIPDDVDSYIKEKLKPTIYQNSNGSILTNGGSLPVGLILDSSEEIEKGQDLITNGTFDTDINNWALGTSSGGTVTWLNGKLRVTYSSGYTTACQAIQVQAGKIYQITGKATWISAVVSFNKPSCVLEIRSSASVSSTQLSSEQRQDSINYSFFYIAESTATVYIHCGVLYYAGVCDFDDISVREVFCNYAYQNTSSKRPLLSKHPSSGKRNLITYSEEFSSGSWTAGSNGTTVTPDAITDPLNGNNADFLNEMAGTSSHTTRQTVSVVRGKNITFSFYAKAGGRNFIRFWEDVATGKQGYFDLANGTATNSDLSSIAIESVGNGWYRCIGTINNFTGTSYGFRIHISTDGTTITYAGDITKGVYLFGAQLEIGDSASNYQKTTANTIVTEAGKEKSIWCLTFDGIDDCLITNSMNFNTWTQDARRNLLTSTESFSEWTSVNAGVIVADSVIAPDGTQTAAKYTISSNAQTLRYPTNVSWVANSSGVVSVWLKKASVGGSDKIVIMTSDPSTWNTGVDNVITLTDTWERYALSGILSTTSLVRLDFGNVRKTSATEAGCNGEFHIWGTQLEAGSISNYQKVGTNKMTVIAGVAKLMDTTRGCIAELTNTYANTNSFGILAPHSSGYATYEFSANGTPSTGGGLYIPSGFSAPITNVLSVNYDLSGADLKAQIIPRVNGVFYQTNGLATATGGNFRNSGVYIGSRGNTSHPFNGHIYQLIIRGAATPSGKMFESEQFVAQKTGISI